jgi:hypothetical protein
MKNKYLKDRSLYVKEHMSQFGSIDNTESVFTITPQEPVVIGHGIGADFSVDDKDVHFDMSISSQPEITPEPEVAVAAYTPADNASGHSLKQEWAIVKVMTNNGVRVGIDKQCDTDCEVICGHLTYQDATVKVEETGKQCNIPVFNDDMDEYIGKVSKAYVKKPESVSNTISPSSYKPNPANFNGNPMGGAI